MKAAIIGPGFIGTELAGQLTLAGHEVVLMGRSPRPNHIPFLELDVLREKITLPKNIDAVFYLAQSPHYREFPKHAGDLFGVNTLGAIKTAEAALDSGCRFFFHASTGNVYSPSFSALSEHERTEAEGAYALSKRMAEQALLLFSGPMSVCVGRIFGAFGPGQKNMLPALIRERLLKREAIQLAPHPINGPDGGLRVSYIYNPDLGRILTGLAEKALSGENVPRLLNLGGPEAVSLERLALEMGKALNVAPVFEHTGSARKFDLAADITLLRQTLHPSFTPLGEALKVAAGSAAQ